MPIPIIWYTTWGLLILLILFLMFWKLYFLRDPERKIPLGENIVSPADGRVIKIIQSRESLLRLQKGAIGNIRLMAEDVGRETKTVSIFMSPLDVHVNRSPIHGKVSYVKHYPGKYHAAYDFARSLENEKTEMLVEGKGIRVKVVQIAGFLARRIETFVQRGQMLGKGQRYGRINLGSQVCLVMPSAVSIKVRENDKVYAGETIIAQIRGKQGAK